MIGIESRPGGGPREVSWCGLLLGEIGLGWNGLLSRWKFGENGMKVDLLLSCRSSMRSGLRNECL